MSKLLTHRQPEPDLMDLAQEAVAYAQADFSAVNQAFVDRLLELHSPPHARVIDLGCGPADIPIRLHCQRPAWQITAVDGSLAMLQLAAAAMAHSPAAQAIGLLECDACATPLPDHSFDVVISNSLLHHVTEPLQMWREIARLAASGGFVFVRDLFRPATLAQAEQIVKTYAGNESQLLQDEFHRSLLAAYTLEEVKAQLRQAGLSGLRVTQASDRHLDITGTL